MQRLLSPTSFAVYRNVFDALWVVVVISFLFVLGSKGRLQPVVMTPKNLTRCGSMRRNN